MAVQGQTLFEGGAQRWSFRKVEGSKRSKGTAGPNPTHLSSRQHIAAGLIENTQANLRKWLENPEAVKQGTVMYRDAAVYQDEDKALSEPAISALVAYLQSLM